MCGEGLLCAPAAPSATFACRCTSRRQRNGADGTAIHGALRQAPWTVVERDQGGVLLEAAAADMVGVNFPWLFAARVGYALTGDALPVQVKFSTCTLCVPLAWKVPSAPGKKPPPPAR